MPAHDAPACRANYVSFFRSHARASRPSWSTDYRGELVICSAKKTTKCHLWFDKIIGDSR